MSNESKVHIQYGEKKIELLFPENVEIEEISLNEFVASGESKEKIIEGINNPYGAGLKDIIRKENSISIIIDDITRPTPTKEILEVLIPILLELGVHQNNISIFVALGTHREMTRDELILKVGKEVYEQYQIYQPDYRSVDDFVEIAQDSLGRPVRIYRKVAETDIKIGIGNIVPHNGLGWSGGAKILFPGVADEASIANFHIQAVLGDSVFGNVKNPVRKEVEKWVSEVGLHFLINTVLDRNFNIVSCVCGDYITAHRRGVEIAKAIYCGTVSKKSRLVIVNGEPNSSDFWQGSKGLTAASNVILDDGDVILLSPCHEGIGPHDNFLEYISINNPTEYLSENADNEELDLVALAIGLNIARFRQHFNIMIFSDGLSNDEVEAAGLTKIENVQDTINRLIEEKDIEHIIIIHDGADILPTIEEVNSIL